MLRIISMLVLASLLAGCNVVFIPIPIGGLTLPTTLPTPEPEQPADVALFLERYETLGTTYDALMAHMDTMKFDDLTWRAETERLAVEWHDAIDRLSGTTQPEGERWEKPWDLIQQALQSYGYAAGSVEMAAREANPTLLQTVRSELVRGATLMADAMKLLGEK
jgi:hypothetical protein